MAKTIFNVGDDFFAVSETGVVDFVFDKDIIIEFENNPEKTEIKVEYNTDSDTDIKFDYLTNNFTSFYIGAKLNQNMINFIAAYKRLLGFYQNGDLYAIGMETSFNDYLNSNKNIVAYKLRNIIKAVFAYTFICENKYNLKKAFDGFIDSIKNNNTFGNAKIITIYEYSKIAIGKDWLTSLDALQEELLTYMQNNRVTIDIVGGCYHKESFAEVKTIYKKVKDIKLAKFIETGVSIDEQELLSTLITGCCVKESDNPHDKNAIALKVTTYDNKIYTLGYLPRSIAAMLSSAKLEGSFRLSSIYKHDAKVVYAK